MATEGRRLTRALVAGCMLLSPAVMAATERDRASERVCVPAADGRSWDCGTRANPPTPRALPDRNDRPSPPPPPFLAAPPVGFMQAPAAPAQRETVRSAPPVATEPVATEPVATEPVATEPVATEPVATEPVATEPVATEPVATEPVATEPVATEPVATEPVATEPVTTESIAAEPVTPEPAASEPAAIEPVDAAYSPQPAPGGRTDFLRLSPLRYTVQVARAPTKTALPVPSGLQPCFAVEVGAPQSQFLLLCGEHADAAAARAAAASAGIAGWPRRIGPLQDEVRRLD